VNEPGRVVGHAFISYIREDSPGVDHLLRILEAAGIPVWRDTASLWPGQDWRANIRHAITGDSLAFVACFSRQSVSREKSYQNEELVLAIEQLRLRRPDEPWLIPVRLDDCVVPDLDLGGGRTLASIQRADLFGEESMEGAARLVMAISRILARGAAAGPLTGDAEVIGRTSGPEVAGFDVRYMPGWAKPAVLAGLIAWLPGIGLFALGGGDVVKSTVAAVGVGVWAGGVLLMVTTMVVASVRAYDAARGTRR